MVVFTTLDEPEPAAPAVPKPRKPWRLTKTQRDCGTGDCGGRCCRCRNLKTWAAGKYAGRARPKMPDGWTPEEDRLLRELAGTMPLPELAERLARESGYRRTVHALRIRCKRLDVSAYAACVTLIELEAVFGSCHRTIRKHWLETGLLPARRWAGRGSHPGWWIERTDVERFIREQAWAYDWRAMRAGHPWTKLAETVYRADPWLSRDEAMAYLRLAPAQFVKWQRRGLIPHRRRPGGGGWRVLVRRSDLPTIAADIAAARERNRRAGWARAAANRRAAAATRRQQRAAA